jgi:hypothetical protein
MPIKMIVMVRRKQGLSPEAFRHGYENTHSRLAVSLFGHLWAEYRRSYLLSGRNFGDAGSAHGPDQIGFDAISEFVLHDEAALAEMGRIGLANAQLIHADEVRWFDRKHCWVVACETIEEDLSG